jgi:hypothetical protein
VSAPAVAAPIVPAVNNRRRVVRSMVSLTAIR